MNWNDELALSVLAGEHTPVIERKQTVLLEWLANINSAGAITLSQAFQKQHKEREEVYPLALASLDNYLFSEINGVRRLGLKGEVDQDAVKERYRKLVRVFHPDKHLDRMAWATDRTEKINVAYKETLNWLESGADGYPDELTSSTAKKSAAEPPQTSSNVSPDPPIGRLVRKKLGSSTQFKWKTLAVLTLSSTAIIMMMVMSARPPKNVAATIQSDLTNSVDPIQNSSLRPENLETGIAPKIKPDKTSVYKLDNSRKDVQTQFEGQGLVALQEPVAYQEEHSPKTRELVVEDEPGEQVGLVESIADRSNGLQDPALDRLPNSGLVRSADDSSESLMHHVRSLGSESTQNTSPNTKTNQVVLTNPQSIDLHDEPEAQNEPAAISTQDADNLLKEFFKNITHGDRNGMLGPLGKTVVLNSSEITSAQYVDSLLGSETSRHYAYVLLDSSVAFDSLDHSISADVKHYRHLDAGDIRISNSNIKLGLSNNSDYLTVSTVDSTMLDVERIAINNLVTRTLKSYADAYVRGNLTNFLQLFSSDAVDVSAIEQKSIRHSYAPLFENTRKRKLRITIDEIVVAEKAILTVSTHYEMKLVFQSGEKVSNEGSLEFQLSPFYDGYKITRLKY